MRRNKTFLPALLLIAAGLVAPAALRADNPPPTKLAVVNLVKAFEHLTEKTDGDIAIQNMVKAMNDEKKKREDELKALEEERKAYKEGTSDYREKSEQLMQKGMEYDTFARFSEKKILLEQRLKTAEIYRRMDKAIQEISQQTGIALVLVADDIDLNATDQQQLLAKISLRKVFYADPSLDITQRLIDKLNTDFKSKSGK